MPSVPADHRQRSAPPVAAAPERRSRPDLKRLPLATAADLRPAIGPFVALVCGLLLMLGGALTYWLEPAPPPLASAQPQSDAPSAAAAALAVERARRREALARAELERKAAEDAAERGRRAALQADSAAEAEARRQREVLARQQAAAEQAQRAAAVSEEAWTSFYRPSERCRTPADAVSVACVNEYVRARREFAARSGGR